MDVQNLFKGIAVVIDDALNPEVGKKDDGIHKIIEYLSQNNIPYLKYWEIPSDEVLDNFRNVSFILLDWELSGLDESYITESVSIGNNLKQENIDNNIRLIKFLNEKAFLPIFIFSREASSTIENILIENKLMVNNNNNNIFIKNKTELINETSGSNNFFSIIENWLKSTPSVYVLKEWENTLNTAKNNLFWDFYTINHYWPDYLIRTYKSDGGDVNYELNSFIYKNLLARTNPINFDEDVLKIDNSNITKDDFRKILECERYLKKNLSDFPFTGDIFKEEFEEKEKDKKKYRYFINIRPECDIVRQRNVELYCLKGRVIDENKINSHEDTNISFEKGSFIEKINSSIVPFIDNGMIVEFCFKDIIIKKWNDLKEKRIGRLLPPYITRVQQRYSFYLQRQGLPSIPKEAINQNES